jgi:Chromatin remodeling factor Mit1 C-terminal Zn finger 2
MLESDALFPFDRKRAENHEDTFKRVAILPSQPPGYEMESNRAGILCIACTQVHIRGHCPLKIAGPEICPLCSLAHYSGTGCPHLKSESHIRMIQAALKASNEPQEIKQLAISYLRGRKGAIVREKKMKALKDEENRKIDAQLAHLTPDQKAEWIQDYKAGLVSLDGR